MGYLDTLRERGWREIGEDDGAPSGQPYLAELTRGWKEIGDFSHQPPKIGVSEWKPDDEGPPPADYLAEFKRRKPYDRWPDELTSEYYRRQIEEADVDSQRRMSRERREAMNLAPRKGGLVASWFGPQDQNLVEPEPPAGPLGQDELERIHAFRMKGMSAKDAEQDELVLRHRLHGSSGSIDSNVVLTYPSRALPKRERAIRDAVLDVPYYAPGTIFTEEKREQLRQERAANIAKARQKAQKSVTDWTDHDEAVFQKLLAVLPAAKSIALDPPVVGDSRIEATRDIPPGVMEEAVGSVSRDLNLKDSYGFWQKTRHAFGEGLVSPAAGFHRLMASPRENQQVEELGAARGVPEDEWYTPSGITQNVVRLGGQMMWLGAGKAMAGGTGALAATGMTFGTERAARTRDQLVHRGISEGVATTAGLVAGTLESLLFTKLPPGTIEKLGGRQIVTNRLAEAAISYGLCTAKTGGLVGTAAGSSGMIEELTAWAAGVDSDFERPFRDAVTSAVQMLPTAAVLHARGGLREARAAWRAPKPGAGFETLRRQADFEDYAKTYQQSAGKTRTETPSMLDEIANATPAGVDWFLQNHFEDAVHLALQDRVSRAQWRRMGLPRDTSMAQRNAFRDELRRKFGIEQPRGEVETPDVTRETPDVTREDVTRRVARQQAEFRGRRMADWLPPDNTVDWALENPETAQSVAESGDASRAAGLLLPFQDRPEGRHVAARAVEHIRQVAGANDEQRAVLRALADQEDLPGDWQRVPAGVRPPDHPSIESFTTPWGPVWRFRGVQPRPAGTEPTPPRTEEPPNAQQDTKAGQDYGRRSPRSRIRQEGRNPPGGGEGVQPGGRGIEDLERPAVGGGETPPAAPQVSKTDLAKSFWDNGTGNARREAIGEDLPKIARTKWEELTPEQQERVVDYVTKPQTGEGTPPDGIIEESQLEEPPNVQTEGGPATEPPVRPGDTGEPGTPVAPPTGETPTIRRPKRPPRKGGPTGTGGGGATPRGPAPDEQPGTPRADLERPDRTEPEVQPSGPAADVETRPETPGPVLPDVRGQNYRIAPGGEVAPRDQIAQLKANIAAIRVLKQLQAEGRPATPEEQSILVRYTGWGNLSNAFDRGKGEAMIEHEENPSRYVWERDENWERKWGRYYKELTALLTPEEWRAASASTPFSHYTSQPVIEAMWDAMRRLGFHGGRVLEPAAGIGHFFGMMPDDMHAHSSLVGVELESLAGNILGSLYPRARTFVQGIENTKVPNNSLDLAISNVPFHQTGPADAHRRYGRNLNLHNYFLARMLDSVKPGGMVVAISTHNTMDSAADQRKFLADKGELVGAIRLPNNAFQANAGTKVVADILFIRKPDAALSRSPEPWTATTQIDIDGKPARINEYFSRHPEMVLGEHSLAGKMSGREDEYTVEPIKGADLKEQLREAIARLPQDVFGKKPVSSTGEEELARMGEAAGLRDNTLTVRDGKLVAVKDEKFVNPLIAFPRLDSKTVVNRAFDYVQLRDHYDGLTKLMLSPDSSDAQIAEGQKKLAKLYDEYVKRHGFLGEMRTNPFKPDSGYYLTRSLEVPVKYVENGRVKFRWEKADIFSKRTLYPYTEPTTASGLDDASTISLRYRGQIDPEWIGRLLKQPTEQVVEALRAGGKAFENPNSGLWDTRERYLSGNVAKKLKEALDAAEEEPRFQVNVKALQAVQPERRPIAVVRYGLGARWIPDTLFQEFAREKFRAAVEVRYSDAADGFAVTGKGVRTVENQNTYGTGSFTGLELLEKAMNLQDPVVYEHYTDEEGKEHRRIDAKHTIEARAAVERLENAFQTWVKADPGRLQRMEDSYNSSYNFYVLPKYDGSHLEMPGANVNLQWRPYQKDAIWRFLQEGHGSLIHAVGAGKTYTMIGTAMEMKRLGMAKKPMIVVDNATLGQFATSFQSAYPGARVLVATKNDMESKNRKAFLTRIMSGDYDCVVMPQSSFDLLQVHPDVEARFLNEQLDQLEEIIREEKHAAGDKAPSVKQLESAKRSLVKKIDNALDKAKSHPEDVVTFDQLGIDALFVDEAHAYKKPPFVTRIKNIAGIDTDASGRAMSMLLKVRGIQDKQNGRGVFFATGTPVTNTMGEAWHIINMTSPRMLEDFGVKTFDRFVSTFGVIRPEMEMNAGQRWVLKSTFSKFANGKELVKLINSSWSILNKDDLAAYLTSKNTGLPEIVGGKTQKVLVPESDAVREFNGYLKQIYGVFEALEGKQKMENSWVPLLCYNAARAAALDIRLVYPHAKDDPGSKVNETVRQVVRIYKAGKNKETQAVFCDSFNRVNLERLNQFMEGKTVSLNIEEDVPGVEEVSQDRFLYQDLKHKLIKAGIPEKEIAIVHDYDTDAKREALFQQVNDGDIRVIIGNSAKMGQGVNMQQRLVALHHLDVPWVPYKLEQREGRILRYGNTNKEVEILAYGMINTLDAAIYNKIQRKAAGFWQTISGKTEGTEFEDPSSAIVMNAREQAAALAGDPRIFERLELQTAVRNLSLESEAHEDSVQRAAREQSELLNEATRTEAKIPGQEALAERMAKEIDGKTWTVQTKSQGGKWVESQGDLQTIVKVVQPKLDAARKYIEGEIEANRIKGRYLSASECQAASPDHALTFMLNGGLRADAWVSKFQRMVTEEVDGKEVTHPVWKQDTQFVVRASDLTPLYTGNATTIEGLLVQLARLPEQTKSGLETMQRRVVDNRARAAELSPVIERPFPKGEELADAQRRLSALEAQLAHEGQRAQHGQPQPPAPDDLDDYTGPGGENASAALPGGTGAYGPVATGTGNPRPLRPRPARTPPTPAPLKDVVVDKFIGALDAVYKELSPASRGKEAQEGAQMLRGAFAWTAQKRAVLNRELTAVRRGFYLMDRDAKVDFVDKMESGSSQGNAKLNQVAGIFREILDDLRDQVRGLGTGHLENFDVNYFPHIWTRPEQARNLLAPQRPLEGSKAFLKQRTIPTMREGVTAGLEPVSWNPADLVMIKATEMLKYLEAQRIIGDAKAKGLTKFLFWKKALPEGWKYVNDPLFTVYGPPEIPIKEAFDKGLVADLMQFAQSMGMDAQRVMKMRGRKWGEQEPGRVTTKFGGPESVLAHEIGHDIGQRYGLYDWILNRMQGQRGEAAYRRQIKAEWRDLADMRWAGEQPTESYKRYVRKTAEKEAVLLEALIHAPELFQQTAPKVYEAFTGFLNAHAELRPLLDVKPTLVMGEGEGRVEVPGLQTLGRWIMPEKVADLLNNHLSPGLGSSPNEIVRRGYQVWRQMANFLNQAQLSFSTFHGVATSMMIPCTYFGEGLRQIATFKPGQMASGLAKIARLPVTPIENLWNGHQLMKAYRTDLADIRDPNLRHLVEALIKAGGHGEADKFYFNQASDHLRSTLETMWRDPSWLRKGGALARLPWNAVSAAVETVMYPVLQWLVPRQKLGMFAMMAADEMNRLGTNRLDDPVLMRQLTKAWDSVDNRLGQLVYDNLFWNRTLKDLSLASVRAVGWNLGTLREYGGAIKDVPTTIARMKSGDALISFRTAELLGTVFVMGTLGAVIHKALTGKDPEELRDYVFPGTGRTRPDGAMERLSLPGYTKDLYAWTHAPGHTVVSKSHPMISLVGEMFLNRDFWGTEIRNPKDPALRQVQDLAEHLGKSLLPFSVRNWEQYRNDGASKMEAALLSASGVGVAPGYVAKSPAQKYLQQYFASIAPAGSRTQEQYDRSEMRRKILSGIRSGRGIDGIEWKTQFSPRQMMEIRKEAKMPQIRDAVHRAPLDVALNAYAIASDAERDLIAGEVLHKVQTTGQAVVSGQSHYTRTQWLDLLTMFRELAPDMRQRRKRRETD